MLKFFRLICALCVPMGVASISQCWADDKSTSDLKKVLNSKGYILSDPAQNWAYPGGFLVTTDKQTAFIELPSDVSKPITSVISADFLKEDVRKKFSLGAILSGMTSLIRGNPGLGLGHSRSMVFAELAATGEKIEYGQAQDLVKQQTISDTVKQWLKTPGRQVMIVSAVLMTKKLSITTNATTNVDITYNGNILSHCSDGADSAETPRSSAPKSPATSPPRQAHQPNLPQLR